jgi:hypothetical protein
MPRWWLWECRRRRNTRGKKQLLKRKRKGWRKGERRKRETWSIRRRNRTIRTEGRRKRLRRL